jgi:TolB-like protein
MTERRAKSEAYPATAAEWFVALDARAPDDIDSARFAAWLDGSAAHEIELERCSAAVEIVRRLADEADLRWAYDEAAALAEGKRAERFARAARTRLPRFGWSAVAALAIAVGVATTILVRNGAERSAAGPLADKTAAQIVASAPPTDSAVLLPGRVIVDVSSVALLPFATAPGGEPERGDLAGGLHRELVRALAAVPGLYVVAAPSAYVGADLAPAEMGAQLGARALVLGSVALEDDRLRVSATVLDAATDEILWQADYDRPVDELRAIQVDLIDGIAAALVAAEPRARALAVRSARLDNGLASARVGGAPFE